MTIAIATSAGLVSLPHPEPLRITPEAIAHGLARQNRWAGATELPVTTAQHSLLVLELPGLSANDFMQEVSR